MTYGNMVCDIGPKRAEKCRVKLAVRGNQNEYLDEVSTSNSDLTTAKYLINSILSTTNKKGL